MTEEVNNTQDYLEMSDEEITNLSEPSFDLEEEEDQVEETTEENQEEVSEVQSEESDESNEENEDSSSGLDGENESESNVDYKEVYEKIFQPFKANGREMQARTPEEVVTLMQMGANYNKKMAGIKQRMPILKMLEKNNLLDENELSYLIDLKEKKPEAIAKLIQDSGIDLYNFDQEQAKSYQPTNRTIPQQELAVEEVLESIKESSEYARTVKIIGNDWDEASRTKLVQNPHLIRVINEHMESGLYDTIAEEVERQKILGNIVGMSDIDAYEAVGTAMYNNMNQEQSNINTNNPLTAPIPTKPREEEVRRNKVVASSNTRKTTKKTSLNSIDILNMSDEEFEKLGNPNFI